MIFPSQLNRKDRYDQIDGTIYMTVVAMKIGTTLRPSVMQHFFFQSNRGASADFKNLN
jgi:hypothetical protein